MRESYDYLQKAILLGEEANDRQVIAYAAAWISWTCAGVNIFDQGIAFGQKAQEMARFFPDDHYLYFKSLGGIAFNYYGKGEGTKAHATANELLEYGRRHSNIRCLVMGHTCMAMSGLASGNFQLAIQSGQTGANIALDRYYKYFSGLYGAVGYVLAGQFPEAQKVFEEVSAYSHEYGNEAFEVWSDLFLGAIYVSQGHMSRGLTMIEKERDLCEERGVKPYIIMAEFILGRIYKQIAEGAGPLSPAIVAKNIGFLLKNVPFAAKKAENHFQKAIDLAQEIGAKGFLGQATLELGLLHKIKKRNDEARKCISDAVRLFEECEADVFLKQAQEELASLK
jgi:tetratricopeptide (TPR) repeat protein